MEGTRLHSRRLLQTYRVKVLLEACIISGRRIGEVWARPLSNSIHRHIALTAIIITQYEMLKDLAWTKLSPLMFAACS